MNIAIIGGGPGGLYFAALMKQLDPAHQITVWERNAPDDTFGFGVVFSDETLGGIENADTTIAEAMARRFARWTDIDIHYRGESHTVGGQGFAAMSRKELLRLLQERCRDLGVTLHFSTVAPDTEWLRSSYDLVVGADGVNSSVRAAHADVFRPSLDRRRQHIHVARHGPGLRGIPVLRGADGMGGHAGARLPLLRHRLHVHRRDARGRLAASTASTPPTGPLPHRAPPTSGPSSASASSSPTRSTATGCSPTTPSG